jgi:alkaline phosphatase D
MKTRTRREVLRTGAGAGLALAFSAGCSDEDGADLDEADGGTAQSGAPPDGGATPDTDASPDTDAAPWQAAAEAADSFPMGVRAGSMTAAGFIVASFVEGGNDWTLRVWADTDGEDAPPAWTSPADAVDGYLKVPVDGVEPATWYRYAFFDDAASTRSPWGRVRTAFAEGTRAPLRVAATACTDKDKAPFPPLALMAAGGADVFCHLGDMSYNDGATDLATYRAAWRRSLELPDMRAMLASTGVYQTLDDHEIVDNSELYDLDPAVRAAGVDAFFEVAPLARDAGERIWRSFRWGATAEFFILDCRLERIPEAAQYISPVQMAWLKSALADSPCHFKIVLNSVPIAALPAIWAAEDDRWAGYPAQRDELLDHIVDADVRNVWWLAGDFHLGAVWRVEAEGPRGRMWEILAGPGGSGSSRRQRAAETSPDWYARYYPEATARHSSGRWAATYLDLDPEADTVRVRFVDGESGQTAYDEVLRYG